MYSQLPYHLVLEHDARNMSCATHCSRRPYVSLRRRVAHALFGMAARLERADRPQPPLPAGKTASAAH